MSEAPLLEVQDLVKHYRLPRERLLSPAPLVRALQGVSFTLQRRPQPGRGRRIGLGQVHAGAAGDGAGAADRGPGAARRAGPARAGAGRAARRARRSCRWCSRTRTARSTRAARILQTVAEPLRVLHGATPAEQRERAGEVLDAVGLRAADLAKYPHEFSGGQRQRIAIARALITRPEADRRRRAGERARRVGAGAGAEPDAGPAGPVRPGLPVHQPRPGGGGHGVRRGASCCTRAASSSAARPTTLFQRAAHPYTRALLQAVPRVQPGARRARRGAAAPIVHRCRSPRSRRAVPSRRAAPSRRRAAASTGRCCASCARWAAGACRGLPCGRDSVAALPGRATANDAKC